MARLHRPHIPLETRCRVALAQLGEMWPDRVIEAARPKPGDAYLKGLGVFVSREGFGALLGKKLDHLAELLGCNVDELRLDHDPALALRQQFRNGRGEVVRYVPDANDPTCLRYRPHGTQYAGSHDVKTRIRGDGAQHSDVVLIKKARKLERREAAEKGASRRKSPFAVPKTGKSANRSGAAHSKHKPRKAAYRWPKRKLQSRNDLGRK